MTMTENNRLMWLLYRTVLVPGQISEK